MLALSRWISGVFAMEFFYNDVFYLNEKGSSHTVDYASETVNKG